jgi:hypothetical protein
MLNSGKFDVKIKYLFVNSIYLMLLKSSQIINSKEAERESKTTMLPISVPKIYQ